MYILIFFCILFELVNSNPIYSVSGTTLSIFGDGVITQEGVQQSGAYGLFTEIIINDGPSVIDNLAFYDCRSLKNVFISRTIISIHSVAFRYCYSLENITVNIQNPYFCTDAQGGLFDIAKTELIRCPTQSKAFNIPSSVNILRSQCFQACKLTYLFIPKSVLTIETGFIYSIYSIETVDFESGINLSILNTSSFAYNGIRSIIIPKSVKFIYNHAFYYASRLMNLTFEEGSHLIALHDNVFRRCPLSNISLPSSSSPISISKSFYDAYGLESIYISESVVSIHSSAFTSCVALHTILVSPTNEYYVSLNNILFDKNKTICLICPITITTFIIPSSMSVIGQTMIQNSESLVNIEVENGNSFFYAFEGVLYSFDQQKAIAACGGRDNISILSSVTTIEPFCCYNMRLLESICFAGSQIISIGNYAFKQCTSLYSIEIPCSIVQIGVEAFYSTSNLSIVTFSGEALRLLGSYCFSQSNISSITLPSSINSIGSFCFESCSNLQAFAFLGTPPISMFNSYVFRFCTAIVSFSIPINVQTISQYCFYQCTSLFEILVSYNCQLTTISEFAFAYSKINCIYLPKTVVTIENNAFTSCTSLFNVSFHHNSTIARLSPSSFASCTNLQIIDIPNSITNIDASVFYNCISLIEVRLSPDNQYYSTETGILYSKNMATLILCPCGLTSVVISNHISSIGDNAFFGCKKLISLTFQTGSSLSTIHENTFYQCTSLTRLDFPDSIVTIQSGAFSQCSNIKIISFPPGSLLDNIGSDTFFGCQGLESIEFGDRSNLKSIGSNTFKGCLKLRSIIIPSSVMTIGDSAFYQCEVLTNITFSTNSNILLFQSNTFYGCISLISFVFPDSILSISPGVFTQCTSLETIIFPPNVQISTIMVGAFKNLPLKTIVFSESATISSIEYFAFESCLITSISINNVGSICGSAFKNCQYLQSVTIHGSFSILSDNMFQGCVSLRECILPSLTHIGSFAFDGCILLEFELREGIISIGEAAFRNCLSLSHLSIPNTLTHIYSNAYRSSGLNGSLTIPNSVQLIDIGAFLFTSIDCVLYCGTIDIGNVGTFNCPIYVTQNYFLSTFCGLQPIFSLGNDCTLISPTISPSSKFTDSVQSKHSNICYIILFITLIV